MGERLFLHICLICILISLQAFSSFAATPQVDAGTHFTVGLKSDGTVVARGDNSHGQCNVGDPSVWSHITQVSAGWSHTVGLNSDRKVVATGDNSHGQCDVSGWSGIKQVSAGMYHTVGLKFDGTVVAVGDNSNGQCNVTTDEWRDIIQVSAGGRITLGLKSNGQVVAVGYGAYGGCRVSGWRDIIHVSAGDWHSVGLTKNKQVVAAGNNWFTECEVGGWSDIKQVSAGVNYTVGLTSEGKVVATGVDDYGQRSFVSDWSDIIQISAGGNHVAGLKSDGSAVTTCGDFDDDCDLNSWGLGTDTSSKGIEFQFSPVSSPQSVSSPFQVTLRAVDRNGITKTEYNGTVSLSSTLGPITPIEVSLVNGQMTCDVRIPRQGKARLIALVDGVYGYSNEINIQGSSNCRSTISGTIVDEYGYPISEADIDLYTNDDPPVHVTGDMTTPYGKFSLDGVEIGCGTYEIRVEYIDPDTGESITKQGIQVNVSGTLPIIMPSIMLRKHKPTQNTPVVLVPGFIGSSTGWSSPYPILSPDILDQNLHIHDPDRKVGFRGLKENLTESGFLVIECPWDWRLKMQDAYRVFLMPKIAEAKTYSSTGKVHIIAHSMGGLLVREYIQSIDYESDIDKFAMVGTPNLGSCNPYYVWEGGDPKLLDDITDSGFSSILNIYSETIKRLWENTYQKENYNKEAKDNPLAIRNFVRQKASSLRQLMSTESFLSTETGPKGTSEDNKNDWLKDLNLNVNTSRMSKDGTNGTVQVGLYVGDKIGSGSTIVTVKVGDPDTLYIDGVPSPSWWKRWSAIMRDGDGTVPTDSATYPYQQGWAESPVKEYAEHMGLIKAFTENGELLNFLTGGQTAASRGLIQGLDAEADGEEPTSNLYVSLNGSVRCYITSPDGQHSGIDPGTGNPVEDIPGTSMVFDVYGGSVGMDNPADGTYTVTIWGEGQQDYGVEIGYIDATRSDVLEYKGFVSSHPLTFTVRVNSAAVPRITVTPAVPAPGGLTTKSYLSGTSLLTRLSWGAVSGQGITGYNIYAAGETDPSCAYVGTVPAGTLSYDTGDAWCASSGIPVRNYVVTAIRADGTESFFSNEAQNKPTRCECDLNADNRCDMRDWLLFGREWGHTDCDTVYCPCDLNGDGRCDMRDWLLFGRNWGRTDCPVN